MMGVPITLPNEPTLETVNVPPSSSSGFSALVRALWAKSFTAMTKDLRSSSSAFLITGTMRFPEGSATATPILISLFLII